MTLWRRGCHGCKLTNRHCLHKEVNGDSLIRGRNETVEVWSGSREVEQRRDLVNGDCALAYKTMTMNYVLGDSHRFWTGKIRSGENDHRLCAESRGSLGKTSRRLRLIDRGCCCRLFNVRRGAYCDDNRGFVQQAEIGKIKSQLYVWAISCDGKFLSWLSKKGKRNRDSTTES